MKFTNLIAEIDYLKSQTDYGVPKYEATDSINPSIIIIASVLTIGAVIGIIAIIKRFIMRNHIIAQALYGSPNMAKPPEDLYGCPRPDEIEDNSKEED